MTRQHMLPALRKREMHTKFAWKTLKVSGHFENLGIDGSYATNMCNVVNCYTLNGGHV
jgi:hypothetical protein